MPGNPNPNPNPKQVGAGGSLGSVIALSIFFSGSFRDDLGLAYMGIYILAVTALLFLVCFPDMGSMLTKPGAIKYDPQRPSSSSRPRATSVGSLVRLSP